MPRKPRTLNAQEQRAWRSLVFMTYLLDSTLDRQMLRDAGMPHTYYVVLVLLYEADDRRMRMSELAGRLRFSPSRLAHAVKSMERSGWVRRQTSDQDRRVQVASLTQHGLETIRRVAPLQIAEVRTRVLDRLTPEQVDQLAEISEAIMGGLEEAPAD
jgi:DNA-binding MarR family transcriptional regulator